MKKISLFIVTLLTLINISFIPLSVAAQPQSVCDGAALAGSDVNCDDNQLEPSDNQFGKLVRTVINTLSIVVGAVSVVMIIIGGFRYVVSGGDSGGVSGAKNTILYALIGLIVVLFAQVLVQFVFKNATS